MAAACGHFVDSSFPHGEERGTRVSNQENTSTVARGHPHNALAWLANHLAASGKSLRAGQIVLTGRLVKTPWLNAGDSVSMELAGLGTVQVTFV
jgi:2-keto-4-pentenoate hydratase